MDFLSKNIRAIQKKRPLLYRDLLRYFESSKASESTIFKAADWDGFNLNYRDDHGEKITLYHCSPQQEYAKSLKLSRLNHPRILVFDGIGLGYHFVEYIKTRPDHVRDILVVEKYPEIFANALKIFDLTPYIESEDYEFFVGLDENTATVRLKQFLINRERLIYVSRVEHFYFEPALLTGGAYYEAFACQMQKAVEHIGDAVTTPPVDNAYGLFNIIRNQDRIASSDTLYDIRGLFTGRPGIVIGAGPSLNKQTAHLKQNSDRLVIACTDAALATLLSNGIQPHCVVCSERSINQKYIFDHLPPGTSIPLITLPSTNPDLVKNYPGPVVFIGRHATYGLWLWPDEAIGPVGLGVSSVAYCALAILGCSSIYLLGQDFSFDAATGTAYAAKSSDYLNTVNAQLMTSTQIEIEGHNQTVVKTTALWKKLLDELIIQITEYSLPTFHVQADGRGALIRGAQRITPEAFWDKTVALLPSCNFSQILEAALSQPCVRDNTIVQLIKRTSVFLDDLTPKIHQAITVLMTDYYEGDGAIAVKDDDGSLARSIVNRWREVQEDLINLDRPLFYFFINCTFGPSHIMTMAKRESLVLDLKNRQLFIDQYFIMTMEWLQALLLWTVRLKYILR
ncbi:MAG: motility associated factor glycosyltransferase family protein [Deltaproteobacteria bacterium]|nr:motility associated factor glycosyltransferase family protein [Deltaproteobacteria bacterium]